MRSYAAARMLFSFLGVISWCVIIIGIFVAAGAAAATSQIGSFGQGPSGFAALVAALPGAGLSLAGLICLAIVQNGRAAVDNAELTQQILQVARDQLEVSRESAKLTRHQASLAPANVAQPRSYSTVGREPQRARVPTEQAPPRPSEAELPARERATPTATQYKGRTIERVDRGYHYQGLLFDTLADAQQHIDIDDAGSRPTVMAPTDRV